MKILIPEWWVDPLASQMRQIVPAVQIVSVDREGVTPGEEAGAEALLTHWRIDWGWTHRFVAESPTLRWIQTSSAGLNHVLTPELIASDIVVTNASGVFDVPIAEMILAYMLTAVKRLGEFRQKQQAHKWHWLQLRELRGLTLGIVGMGAIGGELARLAGGLGMRVVAIRRHPDRTGSADQVWPPDRLFDLLAESDFVAVTAPLTEETRALIDARAIARMKPDAWLINIGRGAIIDQAALVEALEAGRIGGACLDVFAQEPLPEASPLWDMPNVIVTPHNSASSHHIEQRQQTLFLENLRRYAAEEPLLNVADKRAGY